MRMLLPEIPGVPQGAAGSHRVDRREIPHEERHTSGNEKPVYGGSFLIETETPQRRSKTPAAESRNFSDDADYCSSSSPYCGSGCRSSTPARETTRCETACSFKGTWPAIDLYDYGYPADQPCSEEPLMERTVSVIWGDEEAITSTERERAKMPTKNSSAGQTHVMREARRRCESIQNMPTTAHPTNLQPILSRSIGLTECKMPHVSSRVYGGIDEASDPRDSKRTMFRLKSPSSDTAQTAGPKEIVDTIVPKTTVEERLKFVDLEFEQEVEKFVEVPEVFYNDVIVEVPQVVEVVKIVPREEIKENITYVPRFETKYIPKYVEVPIIKIVDRYEEVDEIHEVLKPVVKRSVVDCPQAVLKKVANTVHRKVLKEQPVPIIKHEDVAVYKRKVEPKIIKEDLVNQKPHFIDIPVPYEKSVVKYVDYPYFVNHYRDNVYPVPSGHRVTPVFRQGDHIQVVDVPFPSPYLVTHTSHAYRPPLMNYQVGCAQMQGYTMSGFPHMSHGQGGHTRRQMPANVVAESSLPLNVQTNIACNASGSLQCPESVPRRHEPQCFFRCYN